MPTGVAMHDARERLFAAAERVLLRDGAGALTSRAVTTEAGVAKGLLHLHFKDVDAFLAALVIDRIERIEQQSTELRRAAGTGTVEANVGDALLEAIGPLAQGIVGLVSARPAIRQVTPRGVPVLAETTRMLAGYLTAERGLGRVALDTDVDALAFTLVGAAHLLAVGGELTHETLYGASSQSSIGVITFGFARTRAASASVD
jgi:AcrR family transcriptional regulator